MQNLVKFVFLFSFSAGFLMPVWAVDLKTYQVTYQKNTEQIFQNYRPKFDVIQQQYRKALDALKAEVQSQGNLTKTKAAITEIERFQKAKSMPAEAAADALPEITAYQSGYVKQYNRLEQEMTAELGTLTAKYEQALDRLQKELVKAGKLDDAMKVLPERERAQAALKGYADQLAALKGPVATNAAAATAAPPITPPANRTSAVTPWDNHVTKEHLYLVIDLSRGTKMQKFLMCSLADVPKGGWTSEYKTDKLVLRKIESGTFLMGSPAQETESYYSEQQHEVTLAQPFYIGVFEVTQKQWERVMGDWPRSYFSSRKYREERPVEQVSYYDVLGYLDVGQQWPKARHVSATSFIGKLRAKTGEAFDLPTEAQWEYACRAGTTTPLNSGKSLSMLNNCPNLSALGRYQFNGGFIEGTQYPMETATVENGTAKVGSYLPNAWGLYDMHGNALEWCLDWFAPYVDSKESDPKGASSGSRRVLRGGCWLNEPKYCRSAMRHSFDPNDHINYMGFRIALPADQLAGQTTAASARKAGGNNELRQVTDPPRGTVAKDDLILSSTSSRLEKKDEVKERAMVLIPASTNSGTDPDSGPYTLTLPGSLYMDACEVSMTKWGGVYDWALKNGYIFANPGRAKEANHPVTFMSWYDCLKWCNARSEKEGLKPCYMFGGEVYRIGELIPDCDLTATGYRLPTKEEWQYAARGGLSGKRFPWGDTIQHSQANYRGGTNAYDLSAVKGLHPEFAKGEEPYTSPVGSFAPNGYGLYDMAGNVAERCWNRFGKRCVTVGGDVQKTGDLMRCQTWWMNMPSAAYPLDGFRTVRGAHGTESPKSADGARGAMELDGSIATAQRRRTGKTVELIPTSLSNPQLWKYTFEKPSDGWEKDSFDDSAWRTGNAGFGNQIAQEDLKSATIRTEWASPIIWLRRTFHFSGGKPFTVRLNILHDDDAVIYLNGIQIRALNGYKVAYVMEPVNMSAFSKALKQGRNVLAVSVVNSLGCAYFDLGLEVEQ
jgi:formylglycine-generating enzyme required for sulfatase activity